MGKGPLLDATRITARALAKDRVVNFPPQKVSVSFLQWFFNIDYPRAVHPMEQLEKEGITGEYIPIKEEPRIPPVVKRILRSKKFQVFIFYLLLVIVGLILWHTLPPERGGDIGRETALLIVYGVEHIIGV